MVKLYSGELWPFRHWQLSDGQTAGVATTATQAPDHDVRIRLERAFRSFCAMSGECLKVLRVSDGGLSLNWQRTLGAASESLQGRNPRAVAHRTHRDCYGDLASQLNG